VQDVLAKLEAEAHKLAAKLYESAGAPGGGGPKPPGGEGGGEGGGDSAPSGDDGKKKGVIDAEFEESN